MTCPPWPAMAHIKGIPTTLRSCQTVSRSSAALRVSSWVRTGRMEMSSAIREEAVEQPGDHLGPARHLLEHDVLLARVSAAADRAEPVERGHAKSSGEVAVARAADLRRAVVVAELHE